MDKVQVPVFMSASSVWISTLSDQPVSIITNRMTQANLRSNIIVEGVESIQMYNSFMIGSRRGKFEEGEIAACRESALTFSTEFSN